MPGSTESETGLVIDCATGQGYEMVLDAPGELDSVNEARERTAREQAAEARREAALGSLRGKARRNPMLADLLTVLGLE
jgi:hypothetical protein